MAGSGLTEKKSIFFTDFGSVQGFLKIIEKWLKKWWNQWVWNPYLFHFSVLGISTWFHHYNRFARKQTLFTLDYLQLMLQVPTYNMCLFWWSIEVIFCIRRDNFFRFFSSRHTGKKFPHKSLENNKKSYKVTS